MPSITWAWCSSGSARVEEAQRAFAKANALDPERYPVPTAVDEEFFRQAAAEAIDNLPRSIREYVEDVPVLVEDYPSEELIAKESISPQILGLYVGVPKTEAQGSAQPQDLTRVILFKSNLEKVCSNRDDLVEQIQVTVRHEIGHHLGLSEEDLERLGLALRLAPRALLRALSRLVEAVRSRACRARRSLARDRRGRGLPGAARRAAGLRVRRSDAPPRAAGGGGFPAHAGRGLPHRARLPRVRGVLRAARRGHRPFGRRRRARARRRDRVLADGSHRRAGSGRPLRGGRARGGERRALEGRRAARSLLRARSLQSAGLYDRRQRRRERGRSAHAQVRDDHPARARASSWCCRTPRWCSSARARASPAATT